MPTCAYAYSWRQGLVDDSPRTGEPVPGASEHASAGVGIGADATARGGAGGDAGGATDVATGSMALLAAQAGSFYGENPLRRGSVRAAEATGMAKDSEASSDRTQALAKRVKDVMVGGPWM